MSRRRTCRSPAATAVRTSSATSSARRWAPFARRNCSPPVAWMAATSSSRAPTTSASPRPPRRPSGTGTTRRCCATSSRWCGRSARMSSWRCSRERRRTVTGITRCPASSPARHMTHQPTRCAFRWRRSARRGKRRSSIAARASPVSGPRCRSTWASSTRWPGAATPRSPGRAAASIARRASVSCSVVASRWTPSPGRHRASTSRHRPRTRSRSLTASTRR